MSDSRYTRQGSYGDTVPSALGGFLIGVGVIFVIWLMIFGIGAITSRSTPQSGEIGVVRNGSAWYWAPDWFDNHSIRKTIPNGSGNTYIGLGSDVHYYPVATQQRFFRMATCYDKNDKQHTNPLVCPGADGLAVTVPTSDGVEVTISGTFYLNTAFDDSKPCKRGQTSSAAIPCGGENTLRSFDTQFSTRTFDGSHPYDGNDGWKKFLAAIIEPIIQNNMRQTVSGITCVELVSSCALVQNNGNVPVAVKVTPDKNNKSNVQQIEDQINSKLEDDLRETLGRSYFRNVKFRLGGAVQLPEKVLLAIETAQAAFATVTQAQADVARAKLESKANEEKQAGYNKCPTCAAIDQTKAIPNNITVWAPGSNAAITVGGK